MVKTQFIVITNPTTLTTHAIKAVDIESVIKTITSDGYSYNGYIEIRTYQQHVYKVFEINKLLYSMAKVFEPLASGFSDRDANDAEQLKLDIQRKLNDAYRKILNDLNHVLALEDNQGGN